MMVLGDSTEVKPVYDSDLQELSGELLKFVETYTTNVNVDDINVVNTLEILERELVWNIIKENGVKHILLLN